MPKVKEQQAGYAAKRKRQQVGGQVERRKPVEMAVSVLKRIKKNATYEDIIYELYVLDQIERGLRDIEQGNVLTQEEVGKRLQKWAM